MGMLGFLKKDSSDLPAIKSSQESPISSAQLIVRLREGSRAKKKSDIIASGNVIRANLSKNYGIAENMLSHFAILHFGGDNIGLYVSEQYVGDKRHIDLRDKLIASKLKIISESIADVSLIVDLNDAINKRTEDTEASDVSGLVEELTTEAFKANVSDIHICTRENTGMVLFRINSKLWRHKQFPENVCDQIAGYLYTNLSLPTSRSQATFTKTAKSLSCMIECHYKGTSYKLRFKYISMADGWDIIMRVLKVESPDEEKLTFKQLGYEDSQVSAIELAVSRSIGLVAITGPTGSGKSTTLKTMMEFDPNRRRKKRYSIEDPVEYKIYGVSQISLQRNDHEVDGSNASFTGVLRDILRADPDDVMVGETRDMSTASMLADAVLTGHKMYTTLHTASAIGSYLRLSRLGLDRHILADRQFVAVMIFQRLMPVMCIDCKINAMENNKLTQTQIHHIQNSFQIPLEGIYVANPCGCEKCMNGYVNSTVVAEVLTPDSVLRSYIADGRDDEAEKYFRNTRVAGFDEPNMAGKTAFEHALYKMSQGIIDPNDIETEFEPFQTYEVVPLSH